MLGRIIDIRTVKGLETESISSQRRVSLMNNHKQFRQLLAQCAKGQIAAVLEMASAGILVREEVVHRAIETVIADNDSVSRKEASLSTLLTANCIDYTEY